MSSRRTRIAAVLVLLACIVGGLTWWRIAVGDVQRHDARLGGAGRERLATSTFVGHGVDADHPAPAVLVAHGLGGDRGDVRSLATRIASHGYLVRTWDSRGTGDSSGRVGIAARDGEVADVRALIDELADDPRVAHDDGGGDDPEVAVVGISAGGGLALLAAADDHRIDAIVPIFAWGSLLDALEPSATTPRTRTGADDPGGRVLKVRWASTLFATGGSGGRRVADPCGSLEHDLCTAWSRSAAAGTFTPEARELLLARSPIVAASRVGAPTLFVQGQYDSLFDLDQVVPVAHALERASTPVRMEWLRGGHDAELGRETKRHLESAVVAWLDRYARGRQGTDVGARFVVQLGAGRGYANAPDLPPATTDAIFTLHPAGADDPTDGAIRFASPPLGLPADATTLPGLGDVSAFGAGIQPPASQRARFVSAPLRTGVEMVGSAQVRLQLAGSRPTGTFFVRFLDVGPDGTAVVPRGLVAPFRADAVPALDADNTLAVDVHTPPIAYRLAPGHRVAIEVASTDSAYAVDPHAATWSVALGGRSQVHLQRVGKLDRTAEGAVGGLTAPRMFALAATLLVLALFVAGIVTRVWRRRVARVQEPAMRGVPVVAQGLTKRYPDGRLAVDHVALRVDPGTIVGLVGPNGAGKTTILRALLGLVTPTDGAAWIFGQRVRPGSPMLARVGALVDGPGLLPYATVRSHLVRTWRASGRPLQEAHVDAALAAVGLLERADERVATCSHGMRQRLGIAQALLGRPELVVLDEPTNGLDPAQIRGLRATLRQLAADGAGVLVSSHMLTELEQVCTHVVLVAEGRLLASGPVAEVVGAHENLEAAFLARLEGGGRDA